MFMIPCVRSGSPGSPGNRREGVRGHRLPSWGRRGKCPPAQPHLIYFICLTDTFIHSDVQIVHVENTDPLMRNTSGVSANMDQFSANMDLFVFLVAGQVWYDVHTLQSHHGAQNLDVPVTMSSVSCVSRVVCSIQSSLQQCM